jgi:hypothetical protein
MQSVVRGMPYAQTNAPSAISHRSKDPMPHLNNFSSQLFLRVRRLMMLGLILLGSSLTHAQKPVASNVAPAPAPAPAPTQTPMPTPARSPADTAQKPLNKPAARGADSGKAGGKEDRDSRSPPTQRDERGPTGTGTGTGNNMGPT